MALHGRVLGGSISPAHQEFHDRQTAVIEKILAIPIEEIFIIKKSQPEIPERAKIYRFKECVSCGMMTTEHRARVRDGKFVRILCIGEYGRKYM